MATWLELAVLAVLAALPTGFVLDPGRIDVRAAGSALGLALVSIEEEFELPEDVGAAARDGCKGLARMERIASVFKSRLTVRCTPLRRCFLSLREVRELGSCTLTGAKM